MQETSYSDSHGNQLLTRPYSNLAPPSRPIGIITIADCQGLSTRVGVGVSRAALSLRSFYCYSPKLSLSHTHSFIHTQRGYCLQLLLLPIRLTRVLTTYVLTIAAPFAQSSCVLSLDMAPTNGGVNEEMMDTTGSDKEESSGVITSIEMSMDISPEEPATTNTKDTVVDANEPSAAVSEPTEAEPIVTEPTDNGPTDAELTNTEPNHAEPAEIELADAEPTDAEPAAAEQVMTDADTTEPTNTTIVTDAVADNADPPATIATAAAPGLSPSPQSAENGLSPGAPTASETGDDGPSTPMSGQSAVVTTVTPRPQPDTIDGRSTKTGYVYDVRMRYRENNN